MRLLLSSSSPPFFFSFVGSRHFLFSQWRQNLIVRQSCRPSTKRYYGSFEEMKKGTSAIHGATFFFIKRGMAQRHSIFLQIKHQANCNQTFFLFIFFFFSRLQNTSIQNRVPYFTDYRTIGRIAAFQLNFLGNTKIGRSIPQVEDADDNLGKYRHIKLFGCFFFTSVNICPITMFFGKYM